MDSLLYKLAIAADAEWSRLLRKEFGKRAGDMRYTEQGKGTVGSELEAAHIAFQIANKAWLDKMQADREARARGVNLLAR